MDQSAEIALMVRRLSPLEAELWLAAPPGATGRLLGPRCRYASTVEVAYYAQPLAKPQAGWTMRVVIPEPSLWEPSSPFVYEGFLQVPGRPDKLPLQVGLRSVQLADQGLRLNGKAHALRACARSQVREADLEQLRSEGFTAVICPVTEENQQVWAWADRVGMWVVGSVDTPAAVERARRRSTHPSALAWLIDPVQLPEAESLLAPAGPLLGTRRIADLPAWVQFRADALLVE